MQFTGFLGVALFCLIGFLFSKNKKAIDWKLVIWGIVMQFIIAAIILGKGLISLVPFFIWIWAIAWYNLDVFIFRAKKLNIIVSGAASLVLTGIVIGITYLLGGEGSSLLLSIIWYLFIVVGVVRVTLLSFGKDIKLYKHWSNIAGFLLCGIIFGNLLANGKTGADFFGVIGDAITSFLKFASLGGEFIFGKLYTGAVGWVFIIDVGVATIFFIAFVGLLESVGLMNQIIISIARFVDWNMRGMGIKPLSGAETLVAISSIPMGGDNLLLIKNYLSTLTRSEISLSISAIMATISASLFAAFVSLGISPVHLLAASAMSVPAVIVVSKICYPEVDNPVTRGQDIEVVKDANYGKPMNAIMDSINNAIQTVLIMAGSLVVFISLIGVFDSILGRLDAYVDGQLLHGVKNIYGEYNGFVPGSLKTLLGYIFSPLAFAMGTPVEDIIKMGYLMGTKLSINEFVAFTQLGEFIKSNALTEKSIIIASFALCGYANPGTVAMNLGKVLPFSGNNRENYINLAFKTMFIGAAASWMTAAIAGIISGLI